LNLKSSILMSEEILFEKRDLRLILSLSTHFFLLLSEARVRGSGGKAAEIMRLVLILPFERHSEMLIFVESQGPSNLHLDRLLLF